MNAGRLWILASIAAALAPGMSIAQDSRNQGYLVDSYGNSITTSSSTGLCWRSSDWTPARSVEPCDPVARKVESPAPRVTAAASLSQKAPPAPPPAPAPEWERTAPQNVRFSADALFAFDQSVLKPDGRAELDDFARRLSGTQYDRISVTGHADRFGSNAYNQGLSERRANAVRDHLVGRNVPADRIHAAGRGESEPLTLAADCRGAKSASVIACLQPDRRVHVEVSATRSIR